jgi:hypothetical protein
MPLRLDSLFASMALGYLMLGFLNSQRPVLLTYLSAPLGLSNTTLAVVSTVYI